MWGTVFEGDCLGLIEGAMVEDRLAVAGRGGGGWSRRNFFMTSWNNWCWFLDGFESRRIFFEKMSKGLSLAVRKDSSSLSISGLVNANFGNSVRDGRAL